MGIFPHRSDWRRLLALVSENNLEQAQARYGTLVTMLEHKLQHASEVHQPTVRAVLGNVRIELQEVERELARRQVALGGAPASHAA